MKMVEFASPEWFAAAQAALDNVDIGDAVLTLEHQVLAPQENTTDQQDQRHQLDQQHQPDQQHRLGEQHQLVQHYQLVMAAGKVTITALTKPAADAAADMAANATADATANATTDMAASATADVAANPAADMTANPAADMTADVILIQSAETAAKIRSGQLGALAAIQSGLIEIKGDVKKLLAAADAIAAVDQALAVLA